MMRLIELFITFVWFCPILSFPRNQWGYRCSAHLHLVSGSPQIRDAMYAFFYGRAFLSDNFLAYQLVSSSRYAWMMTVLREQPDMIVGTESFFLCVFEHTPDSSREFEGVPISPMGGKHLSKSASELSSPREMPEIRPRSAAPPGTSHMSVYQKTHSFFSQLKNRWARSKSRERRHKSPSRQDSVGTDYAADLSSDHSTPSTQSPRHRLHTYTDSPLSRVCGGDTSQSSASGSPKPKAPTPGTVAGLDLLPLTSTDDATRRRETTLRQHSFFQLRVYLRRGQGLVAMDKSGTSDPYVKFKAGGKVIYKSKTVYRDLNPMWDESFTVGIEDPFVPIQIKVFDYDWGLQDDFMGAATLDLAALDLGKTTDVTLPLHDPSRSTAKSGDIMLTVTLYPKSQEDKEQGLDLKFMNNARKLSM